jgi:hypothetical protein
MLKQVNGVSWRAAFNQIIDFKPKQASLVLKVDVRTLSGLRHRFEPRAKGACPGAG